jgi:hypothetical protein
MVALGVFGSYARREAGEGSDIDYLLLAHQLPERRWQRRKLIKKPFLEASPRTPSIIAWTVEEFESTFLSIYLDMALDMVILYDSGGYLAAKLARIRQIIREAGLKREKLGREFIWRWHYFPNWSITWEGVSELKG